MTTERREERAVWLIERGQAAGWNPTCYVRALAEFGPHPLQAVWTTQAIHAMQFSSKAEAEGVIAGFLEHPKSLAVEHGFIPDIPVSYAASRPSPAERDRELPKHLRDQYERACEKVESVGAFGMLKKAELAIGRWYARAHLDAASRVSGASDA